MAARIKSIGAQKLEAFHLLSVLIVIWYTFQPLSSEAQGLYYKYYPILVHQLKDEDRDKKEHGKSTIANRKVMYDLEAKSILKSHKRFTKNINNLKILDVGCAGGQFSRFF